LTSRSPSWCRHRSEVARTSPEPPTWPPCWQTSSEP
jgi:hypothetical protein